MHSWNNKWGCTEVTVGDVLKTREEGVKRFGLGWEQVRRRKLSEEDEEWALVLDKEEFREENNIKMKITRKGERMREEDKAWKMTDVKSVRERKWERFCEKVSAVCACVYVCTRRVKKKVLLWNIQCDRRLIEAKSPPWREGREEEKGGGAEERRRRKEQWLKFFG